MSHKCAVITPFDCLNLSDFFGRRCPLSRCRHRGRANGARAQRSRLLGEGNLQNSLCASKRRKAPHLLITDCRKSIIRQLPGPPRFALRASRGTATRKTKGKRVRRSLSAAKAKTDWRALSVATRCIDLSVKQPGTQRSAFPRHDFARVMQKACPSEIRGRRECRCAERTHSLACKTKQTRKLQSPQVRRNIPAFPARGKINIRIEPQRTA